MLRSLTVWGGLALLLCAAAPVAAQTTLPDPRATFAVDYDGQFDQIYPPSAAPLAGFFIQQARFTLTADAGGATRTVTVPRGQMVHAGTEISIPDVVLPVGNFHVVMQWVDGEGRFGGASNSIPFSATRPLPGAPLSFRLKVPLP